MVHCISAHLRAFVVVMGSISASASSGCETKCNLDGFNTTCNERMEWVMAHESLFGKPMSCEDSRREVISNCPICMQCADACQLHKGDLVKTLYFDKKWHFGHITSVVAGGKYEVTLKNIPIIVESTSKLRRAKEPPTTTPPPPVSTRAASFFAASPAGSTHSAAPFVTASPDAIAAKYQDASEVFKATAFGPQFFFGAFIGGAVVSMYVFARKFIKAGRSVGRLGEPSE